MPPVPVPNDDYLYGKLSGFEQRLAAMESQQQSIISNLQGQPVLAFGLSPGSNPAQYGLQLLSQAFGSEVGFFGEDSSGNVALKFRNSSGQLQVQIDTGGVHFYNTSGTEIVTLNSSGLTAGGVTVNSSGLTAGPVTLNSSGLSAGGGVTISSSGLGVNDGTRNRVAIGHFIDGDYGLLVTDTAGTTNAICPRYISGTGSATTSSTTPAAVSGTGVTAAIGASGSAFVTLVGIGEMNGPSTGGGSAYFAVGVDGAAPGSYWSELQTNLTSAQLTAPVSVSREITGLSAGNHSFACYVWSDNTDHTAVLDSAYTIVEPI